jgi:pyruvate kinase
LFAQLPRSVNLLWFEVQSMSSSTASEAEHRARTKIVATVGPACRAPDKLKQLIEAGVDVFRLNMAHGTQAEHLETSRNIRQISRELNRPVAVLIDLAGPKIRLGELPGGEINCELGQEFSFVRGKTAGGPHELTTAGR